jgi:hypothetical protein
MPGLVHSRPKDGVASLAYGIHVPASTQDVDGRDKPGHDEEAHTDEILLQSVIPARHSPAPRSTPMDVNPANGFDFLIGDWRVAHRRLKERLVGSTTWEEFGGT